jgi:hypothetical protein
MIAFLLGALSAGLVLGYPLWRQSILVSALSKGSAAALTDLDSAARSIRVLRDDNARFGLLLAAQAENMRDLRNTLVTEQAHAELCELELRRINEQVSGKCLWPTLADPDVVVAFPKRGAR